MIEGDWLLAVRNLSVRAYVDDGVIEAVRDVSWELQAGETLGVVGESGSGKSVSMSAVMRLLPITHMEVTGSVSLQGRELMTLPEAEMRAIRGKEIAKIFQDPATSFNPVRTIGAQIAEAVRAHEHRISRRAARARAVELLRMVDVPAPESRARQFPHEFSGGMRQRAMIAMALANRPKVLIADEPTTALDVTIQAQILDLLRVAQQETGAATVLISHDLGLIAEMADRVMVMYAGKVLEQGSVTALFDGPGHPYTAGLLASLPRLEVEMHRLLSIPGQPPNLADLPAGCAFRHRCGLSRGRELCGVQPLLVPAGAPGQTSACHFTEEMPAYVGGLSDVAGADITKEER